MQILGVAVLDFVLLFFYILAGQLFRLVTFEDFWQEARDVEQAEAGLQELVEVAPFDDVFNDDVVELERVDDGVVVLRLQLVVAGVGLTCVDLVQLSYLGRNNV